MREFYGRGGRGASPAPRPPRIMCHLFHSVKVGTDNSAILLVDSRYTTDSRAPLVASLPRGAGLSAPGLTGSYVGRRAASGRG